MPWCPKCRNEYREGFTVCADCGVELVDVLGEARAETVQMLNGPAADIEKVYEFLKDNKIKGVYLEDLGEGLSEIQVEKKYQKSASFAIKTYFEKRREEMDEYVQAQQEQLHAKFGDDDDDEDEEEDENSAVKSKGFHLVDDSEGISLDDDDEDDDDDDDDDDDEDDEDSKKKKDPGTFHSSEEKANDAKNSAVALISMGALGLIFEGLVVFHVLPLQINGIPGKVLYGFMAVVFLLLLCFGIMSIFTARRLRASIVDESELKEEILKFCKEEAVETANKMIPAPENGEDESVYFARMDFLKSAIKREPKFQDVADSTIDGLLDENYKELFD